MRTLLFRGKSAFFFISLYLVDIGKRSAGVALSDKLLRLPADLSPASSLPEGLAGTNRKCPQREGLRHWTETHGGISPPLPPAAASGNLCHGITGRDHFVTQMSNKRCVSSERALKRPREHCPCAFMRRDSFKKRCLGRSCRKRCAFWPSSKTSSLSPPNVFSQ